MPCARLYLRLHLIVVRNNREKKMPTKLQGRLAVVTGAGSGIGRAIAQSFSDEGARVVLVDIDGTKAEQAATDLRSQGGDARPFQADVADPQAVNRLRSFVRDR